MFRISTCTTWSCWRFSYICPTCMQRSGGRTVCLSLKQTMYRDVVWSGKLLLIDHPDQTRAAQIHRRVMYARDKFAR